MCTNFFKYVCNKKNLILRIKKNHKAQNQFAQTRVRDELGQ